MKAGFEKIFYREENYNEKKIFRFCSGKAGTYWLHGNFSLSRERCKGFTKDGTLTRKDGQTGKSKYLKCVYAANGSSKSMSFSTNVQKLYLHGGDASICSLKYGYTDSLIPYLF